MVVQVATLDILTERACFNPEVARAIGDAIAMEISHSREELATKADLTKEIAEVRREIIEVRFELKQEIALLRADMKASFAETKSDCLRWMFAAMAGQTALILSIVYFMIQRLH
jgi:hypothetical protein